MRNKLKLPKAAKTQLLVVKKTNTQKENLLQPVTMSAKVVSFADDLGETEAAKKLGFVFAQIMFEAKKIKQDGKQDSVHIHKDFVRKAGREPIDRNANGNL